MRTSLCSVPVAFLLAALVLGCAAPPDLPALDQARAAVERARSAPRVRALAPAELELAEIALEQATAAARAGAPPGQIEHLAYVTGRRAAFAEAHAAAQVARSQTRVLKRALGPAGALLEDQPTGTLLQEDQRGRPVLQDAVAALASTPSEITLDLATLSFQGDEPSGETLEQLAVLAERLLREPGHSLAITTDFALPDPEARTAMERRVEVVRGALLERGVPPGRLFVRAAAGDPEGPRAASSSVVPTE